MSRTPERYEAVSAVLAAHPGGLLTAEVIVLCGGIADSVAMRSYANTLARMEGLGRVKGERSVKGAAVVWRLTEDGRSGLTSVV